MRERRARDTTIITVLLDSSDPLIHLQSVLCSKFYIFSNVVSFMKTGKGLVFNLDFRHLANINCETFKIIRIDDYGEIEKQVRDLRHPQDNIQTGIIEMDLSHYDDEKLEQHFSQDLDIISKLISFAQRRDVFFNILTIEHDGGKIGPIIKSMRTGKKRSIPIIRNTGLEEFLDNSLPLVKNNQPFDINTRINRLLDFWHEAVLFTPSVFEVNIPLFFMAFEMIANVHFRNNPALFILNEDTWDAIFENLKRICDELAITGDEKSRLFGSLGFAKGGSAIEKIMYFLESIGLEHHRIDVNNIKNIRNDIIHGEDIKPNYGGDDPATLSIKCEKLMGKIILNTLNYLDNNHVHGSFRRERNLDALM